MVFFALERVEVGEVGRAGHVYVDAWGDTMGVDTYLLL